MEPTWIVISISALIVIVLLMLAVRGRQYSKPSNLAILGLALVVLGIIFGDTRAVGYSLMGAGVLLSIVDALRHRKKQNI